MKIFYIIQILAVICLSFAQKGCNDKKLNGIIAKLRTPKGYEIKPYFCGSIRNARSIAVSRNKSIKQQIVYISTRILSSVYALIDNDNDGQADKKITVFSNAVSPNGVEWHKGSLYIAEETKITRIDNIDQAVLSGKVGKGKVIFNGLPSQPNHYWRYMKIGPDGKLYVAIGAPCNQCKNTVKNGIEFSTIYKMDLDGKNKKLVTRGVRNSVGFDWHPVTKKLYFTDNGRDGGGDNFPDDELNYVGSEGGDYGYPYCDTLGKGDPILRSVGKGSPAKGSQQFSQRNCNDPKSHVRPVQALGPHKAPLGMRFYDGKMFPSNMKNVAIIANHGSHDRLVKIGYELALVKVSGSQSLGHSIFITGWLQPPTKTTGGGGVGIGKVLGRPVDVDMLPDGSLLVSDDGADAVYRVTYKGGNAGGGLPKPVLKPGEKLGLDSSLGDRLRNKAKGGKGKNKG